MRRRHSGQGGGCGHHASCPPRLCICATRFQPKKGRGHRTWPHNQLNCGAGFVADITPYL